MPLRLAVPDLISPSYFPAIAAVTLGCTAARGLDVDVELVFPVTDAVRALADGELDFLAGAAHSPLYLAEPNDVVEVGALSHGTYWFLVLRPSLAGSFAELGAMGPLRIGAAPGVESALRVVLADAGFEVGPDGVEIVPVPPRPETGRSFGVGVAAALADGLIDGFWANGMGAEVAVRAGTGRVVLDARRAESRIASLTFPALMTAAGTAERAPDTVAALLAAVTDAQARLAQDAESARGAVAGLFPDHEAALIGELVARDTPFYDRRITLGMVDGVRRTAIAAQLPGASRADYGRLFRVG